MTTPVPAHIASITRPVEKLFTYYVLKAIATTVGFFITMPVLYFRFHTMKYRFDEEGIRMSWGIIFRHQVILNYARIQDIHLESNAIERYLGLARIQIQTASGASTSEMILEGLTDPEAMRDFLYSRMRGAHEKPVAPVDPLAETLTAIAAELRAIRVAIEARP